MALGMIGKKLGMTQLYDARGAVVPVTVLLAGPCYVTQIKTPESKDGYAALQLGFDEVRKERMNQPERGHLRKPLEAAKVGGGLRTLREFRIEDAAKYELGQKIDAANFKVGDLVDVTGTSIGKGFQGTVKRHHFHRGPMSHGSKNHRLPGSIGAGTTPGRVYKGRKMPGRMGGKRATVRFLEVVRVDVERNVIAVKGAVPGVEESMVLIKPSIRVGSTTPAVAKSKK